jgi:hypothetical protein
VSAIAQLLDQRCVLLVIEIVDVGGSLTTLAP